MFRDRYDPERKDRLYINIEYKRYFTSGYTIASGELYWTLTATQSTMVKHVFKYRKALPKTSQL